MHWPFLSELCAVLAMHLASFRDRRPALPATADAEIGFGVNKARRRGNAAVNTHNGCPASGR